MDKNERRNESWSNTRSNGVSREMNRENKLRSWVRRVPKGTSMQQNIASNFKTRDKIYHDVFFRRAMQPQERKHREKKAKCGNTKKKR